MPGGQLPFLFIHHPALAGLAKANFISGLFKVHHFNGFPVQHGGDQGGLIDYRRQIRTAEHGSLSGQT